MGNEQYMLPTSEQASVVLGSIIKFSSEEEAVDVLIRKARYGKKF